MVLVVAKAASGQMFLQGLEISLISHHSAKDLLQFFLYYTATQLLKIFADLLLPLIALLEVRRFACMRGDTELLRTR
jgi:hypothetical protein